jgi:hypothetical protein
MDPRDKSVHGLANSLPGLRYFWDFHRNVTQGYGLVRDGVVRPTAFLVDPFLRVVESLPAARIDELLDSLQAIAAAERVHPTDFNAPVLTVPRILEPEACQTLIDFYRRVGGTPSGFMRYRGAEVYGVNDHSTKRRHDAIIEDPDLRAMIRTGIQRLAPILEQAFWWRPTRIERYIVARYGPEDGGGFFSRHRDNTTPATAHRRFAVTINLNDDFEGGELRFPEFGQRTYRPPMGGATVFNCCLLHEATPVTRGERFATLPFLYDDSGDKIRQANQHTLKRTPEGETAMGDA